MEFPSIIQKSTDVFALEYHREGFFSFCWKEISTLQMGTLEKYWATAAMNEKRNQEIALWA